MNTIFRGGFAVLFSGFLLGCGAEQTINSSTADALLKTFNLSNSRGREFSTVQSILLSKCIRCHSTFGGHSESDWINRGYVVPKSPSTSLLYLRINGLGSRGPNMPQGGSLSREEIQAFESWIFGLSSGPTPEPPRPGTPNDVPSSVHFIWAQKCTYCHFHSSSGTFPIANFSNKSWVDSNWVDPGFPASSRLMGRLKESNVNGPKDMPQGAGALTSQEFDVLRGWIRAIPSQASEAALRTQRALSIISTSCTSCHQNSVLAQSAGYRGAAVPAFSRFRSDSDFVVSGLVSPGFPAYSWLYQALKNTPGPIASMPKDPGSALSESDLNSLRDWISKMIRP